MAIIDKLLIKRKNSNPGPGDLAVGELGYNTAAKKLFVGDGAFPPKGVVMDWEKDTIGVGNLEEVLLWSGNSLVGRQDNSTTHTLSVDLLDSLENYRYIEIEYSHHQAGSNQLYNQSRFFLRFANAISTVTTHPRARLYFLHPFQINDFTGWMYQCLLELRLDNNTLNLDFVYDLRTRFGTSAESSYSYINANSYEQIRVYAIRGYKEVS